jgi:hypothetical protein
MGRQSAGGHGEAADNAKTDGFGAVGTIVLSDLKRKDYSMWDVVPQTSSPHMSEGYPSGGI